MAKGTNHESAECRVGLSAAARCCSSRLHRRQTGTSVLKSEISPYMPDSASRQEPMKSTRTADSFWLGFGWWNERDQRAELLAVTLRIQEPLPDEAAKRAYTAQGFEFDYMGVIFGNDLVFESEQQSWKSVPANSNDTQVKRNNPDLTRHLQNVYRVLMSRAHRGVC